MAMTATQLGRLLGLGAAATNLLLRDHGFVEGHPGAWIATERGKPFANALGDGNGNGNDHGGYAARSWNWLAWSDDILPVLKASMETNPKGVSASAVNPTALESSETPHRGRNALLAAATVGAVAVVAPAAKRPRRSRG